MIETNDKQDRGQLQILLLKLNKKIGKKFDSILKNSDLNGQQQSTIQTIVKAAETALKKESGLKLKEQHTKQNEGWVDWVVSGGKKVVKKGIEVTDTVSNRLSPGWEKDKFNTAIASLQEIASKYAVPKQKIQEEEVQSEWTETKDDEESEGNISKGKTGDNNDFSIVWHNELPKKEKRKTTQKDGVLQEIASKYAVPKQKIQEEEVQSEWTEIKDDEESEHNISKGKTGDDNDFSIQWHDELPKKEKRKTVTQKDDLDDFEIISGEVTLRSEKKFNRKLDHLLAILNKPSDSDSYTQFNSFLEQLRVVLNLEDFQELVRMKDPRAALVLSLCEGLFSNTDLIPQAKNVLYRALQSGVAKIANQEEKELVLIFDEYQKQLINFDYDKRQALFSLSPGMQAALIDKADCELKENRAVTLIHRLSSQVDTKEFPFDPILQGNIPFRFPSYCPNQKSIQLLRFATPTAAGSITPEFKGFIQKTHLEGKKHVYFSLQSREGLEGVRNKALYELSQSYPEAFKLIILDKNSHFYQQHGKEWDQPTMDTDVFKDKFLEELTQGFLPFTEGANFYFPPELQQYLVPVLKNLMQLTENIFFPEQEQLSKQDRLNFITLYYGLLELAILRIVDPDSANITCKDAIDRAGEGNSILFQLVSILEKRTNSDDYLEDLAAVTQWPAFSAKKQGIITSEGRRERLESATAILKNPVVQQKLLREKEMFISS